MSKLINSMFLEFDLAKSSSYNVHESSLIAAKEKVMSAIISKPAFDFELLELGSVNYPKIATAVSEVGQFYPGFKDWLYFTFRRGFNINERKILLAHCGGAISAVSLLKDTADEKKICTFFVLPEYRFMGLSSSLMEKSLLALGDADVSISVAEERVDDLVRILTANGFYLTEALVGAYRKEKVELFYKR